MKKTLKLQTAALTGVFILALSSPGGLAQAPADKTGFQLLERLVVLMVKAAAPGGGGGDIGPEVVQEPGDENYAKRMKGREAP